MYLMRDYVPIIPCAGLCTHYSLCGQSAILPNGYYATLRFSHMGTMQPSHSLVVNGYIVTLIGLLILGYYATLLLCLVLCNLRPLMEAVHYCALFI